MLPHDAHLGEWQTTGLQDPAKCHCLNRLRTHLHPTARGWRYSPIKHVVITVIYSCYHIMLIYMYIHILFCVGCLAAFIVLHGPHRGVREVWVKLASRTNVPSACNEAHTSGHKPTLLYIMVYYGII